MAKQFIHPDDSVASKPSEDSRNFYEGAILSDNVQHVGKNIINLSDIYAYFIESKMVEKPTSNTSELLSECRILFNPNCKPCFKTDVARQVKKMGLNITTHEPFRAIYETYDHQKLRENIKRYHSRHDKGEIILEKYEEIKPRNKSPRLTPYGRALKIPALCDSIRTMKDTPVELIEFLDEIKAKFEWIKTANHPLEYKVLKGADAQKVELTPAKPSTPTEFTSEQLANM